ncbi:head GIN domain-containing protein [Fulvivirga sediminis]|uniref:DUF2807 domain-containing protein n=1 Tax=Fulvivirga sediminis TaxID=2803949 RepID=A0A937JYK0_9BACT|nr:head GIN domain-containing protein [Fulvivirga sediminis]MBL3656498.1 DUF2807 domain-containing protein [Fulvivirga sediminis]
MKTIYTLLLLIAASSFSFGQKTENRSVSDFSEIVMNTSGSIYLSQGNSYQVTVEGDEGEIENLITEVKGNRLVIKRKKSFPLHNVNSKVKINITLPKLETIDVSSSGKIHGQNKFTTDNLQIGISGSGKVELEAESKELDLSISGSGKMTISGTANKVSAQVSGSGHITSTDLETKECRVNISGSGGCEVNVTESLNASVSGSGSIKYKGNPGKVKTNTSGSGRVRKI